MLSVLARHRYRCLLSTGSFRYRTRAQLFVFVSTSALSSLVIDEFETLPCWMRGLSSHVIAVIVFVRCSVLSLLLSPLAQFTPIVPGLGLLLRAMCGLC